MDKLEEVEFTTFFQKLTKWFVDLNIWY
jgi:hypothetical protein